MKLKHFYTLIVSLIHTLGHQELYVFYVEYFVHI
jgi:hypothetical protein